METDSKPKNPLANLFAKSKTTEIEENKPEKSPMANLMLEKMG